MPISYRGRLLIFFLISSLVVEPAFPSTTRSFAFTPDRNCGSFSIQAINPQLFLSYLRPDRPDRKKRAALVRVRLALPDGQKGASFRAYSNQDPSSAASPTNPDWQKLDAVFFSPEAVGREAVADYWEALKTKGYNQKLAQAIPMFEIGRSDPSKKIDKTLSIAKGLRFVFNTTPPEGVVRIAPLVISWPTPAVCLKIIRQDSTSYRWIDSARGLRDGYSPEIQTFLDYLTIFENFVSSPELRSAATSHLASVEIVARTGGYIYFGKLNGNAIDTKLREAAEGSSVAFEPRPIDPENLSQGAYYYGTDGVHEWELEFRTSKGRIYSRATKEPTPEMRAVVAYVNALATGDEIQINGALGKVKEFPYFATQDDVFHLGSNNGDYVRANIYGLKKDETILVTPLFENLVLNGLSVKRLALALHVGVHHEYRIYDVITNPGHIRWRRNKIRLKLAATRDKPEKEKDPTVAPAGDEPSEESARSAKNAPTPSNPLVTQEIIRLALSFLSDANLTDRSTIEQTLKNLETQSIHSHDAAAPYVVQALEFYFEGLPYRIVDYLRYSSADYYRIWRREVEDHFPDFVWLKGRFDQPPLPIEKEETRSGDTIEKDIPDNMRWRLLENMQEVHGLEFYLGKIAEYELRHQLGTNLAHDIVDGAQAVALLVAGLLQELQKRPDLPAQPRLLDFGARTLTTFLTIHTRKDLDAFRQSVVVSQEPSTLLLDIGETQRRQSDIEGSLSVRHEVPLHLPGLAAGSIDAAISVLSLNNLPEVWRKEAFEQLYAALAMGAEAGIAVYRYLTEDSLQALRDIGFAIRRLPETIEGIDLLVLKKTADRQENRPSLVLVGAPVTKISSASLSPTTQKRKRHVAIATRVKEWLMRLTGKFGWTRSTLTAFSRETLLNDKGEEFDKVWNRDGFKSDTHPSKWELSDQSRTFAETYAAMSLHALGGVLRGLSATDSFPFRKFVQIWPSDDRELLQLYVNYLSLPNSYAGSPLGHVLKLPGMNRTNATMMLGIANSDEKLYWENEVTDADRLEGFLYELFLHRWKITPPSRAPASELSAA